MNNKSVIFLVIICAFFCVSASAQIPNKNAVRLKTVEKLIAQIENLIKNEEDGMTVLLVKYNADSPEIKTKQNRINSLQKNLAHLEIEKKKLLDSKLTDTLSNNQIELLKILIVQNSRIIDLLEKLVPE